MDEYSIRCRLHVVWIIVGFFYVGTQIVWHGCATDEFVHIIRQKKNTK